MPAQTHVALFGVPRVSSSGREVALSVRKTLALLAYLAVEGRASRARLAELFWGDLDEATARRNLRRALHRLRSAGLDAALRSDDDMVALAGVRCDVLDFDAAVRAERWADARALCAGRLCDGLELEDAEGFDAWLRARREQVERDWRHVLARHAAELEAAGDLRAAIDAHRRLLADDNLQEATYRALMRLHDALGERAAALDTYERCQRTLGDELGLEPLPETRLLADRIHRHVAAGSTPTAGATLVVPTPANGIDLQAVPLVARERELAALAQNGAPVVLIEGEAGVGKSRLAVEACRRAPGGEGGETLVVRFTELAMATPFHALTDTLRAAAAAGRLAGLDAVWQTELARLLPEWRPAGAVDTASAAGPAEARTRLLEALLQALARAAGAAQRVLFDDLHWADASSLELLAHLARRRTQALQTVPGVIATARGVELAGNTAAQIALAAIEKDSGLARLPLAAFDDWSMLQFVQQLSRSGGGLRFATRLGSATGGNVFFALETIRALFEAGELRADPVEGWSTRYDDTTTDYAELPLPASVVEAVRARVARLGAAAQRVLETAALAEDGCSLAEIQGATALTDWEALEGIERAVAARVVDRAGGGGYRFVHELFRSAIRSGLSPERQRLVHAKLAAALGPLQAAPARIAAHWEAAGDAAAAARAWTAAGEAATQLHSHREASAHLARAAALTADGDEAFALHERALDRLMVAALSEERRTMMLTLLERAERSGSPRLRLRALARASQAATMDRRYEEAERLALQAVAQLPALREFEAADVVFHVHALSCAAFAAGTLGRAADALARYRAALGVAQRHGNARAEAMMAGSAAMFAVQLDRLDEARALRDQSLAACSATLGTIHHAQALSRASYVARADGERALGIAQLGEAAAIARRTRSSNYLPNYLAMLTEALVDDGQHDAARATHRQCLESFAEEDPALARYLGPFTAAAVHEAHGELGAAVEAARAAVTAADALDNAPDRREARLLLAGLLAPAGAEAEALRLADAAEAIAPPPPGCRLLPAENLRAAAALPHEPLAAQTRLERALVAPYADRLPQPHLAVARILLGRCALAGGRHDDARARVQGLRYSVAVEAEAAAVALEAAVQAASVEPAELAAAIALIDSDRLAPLAALTLMRAVAAAGDAAAASHWQARLQATAQALADSLAGSPALQSAFIRRHRDLLT